MKPVFRFTGGVAFIAMAMLGMTAPRAGAEEIAVAQYGSTTSAMPWAVALAKGFFKEAGVDITDIRASSGGSADIRNMIAGGLPYAESSPAAVMAAVKNGADVKIVNENAYSNANDLWIVPMDSPIKSLADLKGKRLTYTTPQSTSEMLDHLIAAKLGLTGNDVKYVSVGPYGASYTVLQAGGADVALMAEPLYTPQKSKYRAIAWARDVLPSYPATIGVVPTEVARSRPEVVRGIVIAHRRAVEFMNSNPKEAAAIIAKAYKMDPAVLEIVLAEIQKPSSDGIPYFGLGNIDAAGMDRLMDGLKLINALDTDLPWRSLVDQSFLPDDLKRKL